jgi:hypothetical protein
LYRWRYAYSCCDITGFNGIAESWIKCWDLWRNDSFAFCPAFGSKLISALKYYYIIFSLAKFMVSMSKLSTVIISIMGFGSFAWSDAPATKLPIKQSHFCVEGNLLYWAPQISGLESNFGSTYVTQRAVEGVAITGIKEKDVDPSYDWTVGYRILGRYQFANNLWDLVATWTSFNGSGYKAINYGKWNVTLEQIDAALLYNAYWSSWFTSHPFIGVRATKINQALFSEVICDVMLVDSGLAFDTKVFNDREKFRGIGPLFGINGDIILGYGFGLYGSISASLLYGSYRLYFKDHEMVTLPANPSYTMSDIHKHITTFNFNIDLGIGAYWKKQVHKSIWVTAKIGIETHQYFNQNRLGGNTGDLSFSGLVFSGSLEF